MSKPEKYWNEQLHTLTMDFEMLGQAARQIPPFPSMLYNEVRKFVYDKGARPIEAFLGPDEQAALKVYESYLIRIGGVVQDDSKYMTGELGTLDGIHLWKTNKPGITLV